MNQERLHCYICTFVVFLLVTMCSSSIRYTRNANIFDRWTNWGNQPGQGSLNGFSVANGHIFQRNLRSRCANHSYCEAHEYCSCHHHCVSRYGHSCTRNGRQVDFDFEERFRSQRDCRDVVETPGSVCSSNSQCGCGRHCSCHGHCVSHCHHK